MNTLVLFRDGATRKWAFRLNDHHFWTSFDVKQPADVVMRVVKLMNPRHDVVLAEEPRCITSCS